MTSFNPAGSIITISNKSLAIRDDLYRINVPFVARRRLDGFDSMNVPRFGKGMADSRKADHLDSPTTSARETMVLVFFVLILSCTAHLGKCVRHGAVKLWGVAHFC